MASVEPTESVAAVLLPVGLVPVDLAGGGSRDGARGLPVDVELEGVIVGRDGNGLAGVDHADLDSLSGDHDLAALGYPPLHRDRPGGAGAG
jgi:hypothetical protein